MRTHFVAHTDPATVLCGRAQGVNNARTWNRAAVTCAACKRELAAADASEARARYLANTTMVGGRRAEMMPCECGAAMVAGIDHTCDPQARRERGLSMA